MNTTFIVELQATGIRFFSHYDEKAFFEWLDKLSFVESYQGRLRTLYILINSPAVDEEGLRELLSLFRRYEIELTQLAVFDREEFADWFRDERAYWYKEIFDSKGSL
jgi:hypothetical protein